MTLPSTISGDAIRETFQEWNAERDSLDAELSESLVALEAYQLAPRRVAPATRREREELQTAREQFDRDREFAEKNHSEAISRNDQRVARRARQNHCPDIASPDSHRRASHARQSPGRSSNRVGAGSGKGT